MIQTNADKKFSFKMFISKYGVILALVFVIIFFGIATPNFLTFDNFANILRSTSVITILSLGLTITLAANAFNLAVTGIGGLTGALVAGLMVWNMIHPFVAVSISLAVGVLFGVAIALFVIRFKVDDMLASLGAMYIAQGLTLTYTDGLNIYSRMMKPAPQGGFITAPGEISQGFIYMGQGMVGLVPVPVIITLVIVVLVHLFLNNTRWGRNIYSVGANPEAAYLAGISVNKYKILAYALSGLLAAFGGDMLVARLGSAQIAESQSMLLDTVAAAYIGFSFLGLGKPSAFGAFVGATLMGTITNGLSMLGVSYTTQDIFKGLILLLSLVISKISQ